MATEKQLISVMDCPCDECKAKPCGHPARCVKFTLWLNKTVDAVEVVHGRWLPAGHDTLFECSVCGGVIDPVETSFCPNCGAKMDGDGNG